MRRHAPLACWPGRSRLPLRGLSPQLLLSSLLSLCLIARDEAAHLERCLRSVSGLVAETIVVDTGSADATPALARAAGARVLSVPWENDFARARNAALAAATQPWILVLDADEYLPPVASAALPPLLARTPPGTAAFQLVLCNHRDGHEVGGRSLLTRVFPNRPDLRYEWPVHEQIDPSLRRAGVPLRATDIPFIHTGYADPLVVLAKQQRNHALLQAVVAAGRATAHTHYFLGAAAQDLGATAAAAASYARAATWPADDPVSASIRDAALVKLVECHAAREDHAAVLAAVASRATARPSPDHPSLLFHYTVARLRHSSAPADRPGLQRELARLLDTPAAVHIPPLDLAWLKGAVLSELFTQVQRRGETHAALALLHLGRTALAAPTTVTTADALLHLEP